jgi:TrmH family RNA methyltransferase
LSDSGLRELTKKARAIPHIQTPVKLLTLARDLTRRKARERQGLFVAEGVRCVEELVASPLPLHGALIGPQLAESPRGQDLLARLRARTTVEEVSAAEFASAAATDSPQGVLGLGAIPDRSLAQLGGSGALRLLVLDGIQDPGNVGTILRTAAALGATAAVALPGTVDLWNAKVVRSAMGALFSFPAFDTTWDALDAFRADRGLVLWGADTHGDPVARLDVPPAVGLVVGNEGAGLSEPARSRIDRVVSIPMASSVESLNVAVATGVLLYEIGLRRAAASL